MLRRLATVASLVLAVTVFGVGSGRSASMAAPARPGAAGYAAQEPAPAPVRAPMPTPAPLPGLDPGHPGASTAPELAGVVVTSGAVDQARRNLERAQAAAQKSQQDKADLVAKLADLVRQRDETVAAVADADQAVLSARADLDAARQRRTDAQLVLLGAEQAVEAARAQLKDVAVAAYVTGGDPSQILLLSRPDHFLDSERRHALSQASSSARTRDLLVQIQFRQHATQVLHAAETAVQDATDALARAISHRDDTQHHLEDLDGHIARTTEQMHQADTTIAQRFAEQAKAVVAEADARVLAPVDGADFPLVALDAYWKAAQRAPCRVEWWALAGITYIESKHGTDEGSHLDALGETTKRIVGIPLDGSKGDAAIHDTDGGALDGDPVWDRAVGPMQFIPSTWKTAAVDGNGDAKTDPSNLYDAAAAAAKYLCTGRSELTTDASLHSAFLSYNQSELYASVVLTRAHLYQRTVPIPPPSPAA